MCLYPNIEYRFWSFNSCIWPLLTGEKHSQIKFPFHEFEYEKNKTITVHYTEPLDVNSLISSALNKRVGHGMKILKIQNREN